MDNGKITRKLEQRVICGEMHLSVEQSARLLGCSTCTMRTIISKAQRGTLRPPLSWYRDKPRSPIWIKQSSLEEWARKRGEMHV